MNAALALLVACLALAVPAALALPTTGPVAGVADLPATLPSGAPGLPLPEAPDVGQVEAGVSASASAQVGDGGVGVAAQAGPDPAPQARDPTMHPATSTFQLLGPKGSAAAQEAAGASLLAMLLVALGSGLDGLKALAARPQARLQQLGRLALRLVPFLPLFSRIETGQALEHPVRARIHGIVGQEPGVSLEEVRSRAGIAHGTAVHHLRRLEATGHLVSVSQGARRRYFPANTLASSRRGHVAALAQPTARRVADLVRQRPGIDQTGLCLALGLRNPAASKHLQQLAGHGLVLMQRQGRRCHYHPTEALHTAFGIVETGVPLMTAPNQLRAGPTATGIPAGAPGGSAASSL